MNLIWPYFAFECHSFASHMNLSYKTANYHVTKLRVMDRGYRVVSQARPNPKARKGLDTAFTSACTTGIQLL